LSKGRGSFGVNLGRPIVTNGAFATRLFSNYIEHLLLNVLNVLLYATRCVCVCVWHLLHLMQGVTINESYCGEAEQNGPLVGSIGVESSPILTFPDTQLTSVAAAAVNGHAVIYLGTQRGHLKKVGHLTYETRSHPEMVGDMSRVTLNFKNSFCAFLARVETYTHTTN